MTNRTWADWVQEYLDGCDNPDFKTYAKHVRADDPRFVWLIQHLAALGGMRDARVLDIGCGFGWDSAAVSLFANADVVANDIRPQMTSVVDECTARLKSLGAPISLQTLTEDICAADIPAASFDSIMCQQTLEHVHDLSALFATCHRVMKPGGVAVFTNDNNALNAAQMAEIEAMWVRRDTDWDYIEDLRRARPIENAEIAPYQVMRADMIKAHDPALAPPKVEALARATAGLTRPEILAAVDAHAQDGRLPTPPARSWCRDPETGEYCERQLDPYELARMLKGAGFRARVRHGFRKLPLTWLNAVNFAPLNRALFNLRPFFIITAQRA